MEEKTQSLDHPDLVYVSDDQAGLSRRRRGKGFSYYDERGHPINDPALLERIRSLGIPPAWKNVWICAMAEGYLQATGIDEKGRKQYIYHPEWSAHRQAAKFGNLKAFAERLPYIRQVTDQHLRDRSWTQRKVLALVVKILDKTSIRIGNTVYKEQNQTFGLTTLRRKHLRVEGNRLTFSFKGKSNKYHQVTIRNQKLARAIRGCSELPGHEIFTYIDENGRSVPVSSREVNRYIQEIAGEDFSSKDFRTWAGSSGAVMLYPAALEEIERQPRRDIVNTTVRLVAKELGNTLAVCRKYYIHPAVLEAIENRRVPEAGEIMDQLPESLNGGLEGHEMVTYYLISQDGG